MLDGIVATMAIAPTVDEHYHMCMLHGKVNACNDTECVLESDVNLRCITCDSAKQQVINSLAQHPLDLARIFFTKEVMC